MVSELKEKVPTVATSPTSIGAEIFRGIRTRELVDKIQEFRSYGQNWGGYGEQPVNFHACDRAAIFVLRLAFTHPRVAGLHVYPTAAGKVGVEWRSGLDDFAAIFSSDGAEVIRDSQDETKSFQKEVDGRSDVLAEFDLAS